MKTFSRIALLGFVLVLTPFSTQAGVFISVNIAPPPLPYYEQPRIPDDGYIWTPGYWAYDDDYYWVPGTWVLAPYPGYLWTPAYWGWQDDIYIFHRGYWGPHVGFYGGINYGYGYGGYGYQGGRWDGGRFFYNRSVNNVNVTNIHNTYNTTVVNNVTVNHVSFNGGNGGTNARPTRQEQGREHEQHMQATGPQADHEQAARNNPDQRAKFNGGRPSITATQRPAVSAAATERRSDDKAGGAAVDHQSAPRYERDQPLRRNLQPHPQANGDQRFDSGQSVDAQRRAAASNHAQREGQQHPTGVEASRPDQRKEQHNEEQQREHAPRQNQPPRPAPQNLPHPQHPQHPGEEGHKE